MIEELLDAGLHEAARLRHHVRRGPAREIAAQARDDAERAAVVAALRDLHVRVVARGQVQPLGRHEIDEGIVERGHRVVHRRDHGLVLVRAGDGEHVGMHGADARLLDAHAPRDDDAPVLGDGLADGGEALLLGRVQKPAGVDDDHVGAGVVGRDRIALGAELRDDALGIDERLGAAERHEADFRHALSLARLRHNFAPARLRHDFALARLCGRLRFRCLSRVVIAGLLARARLQAGCIPLRPGRHRAAPRTRWEVENAPLLAALAGPRGVG